MEQFLWIGLFLPLAGFLLIMFLSSVLPRPLVNCIGPGTILCSFLTFCYILYRSNCGEALPGECILYTWIPVKPLYTNFSLHLDHLALLMTLIVTGVGFLIHAYSVGYMEEEKDIARYFAVMNFFIFSMLLLVLASDLLVLFVGWEGVGVASYLLIGFWYQKPAAANAAKKAFVVNRIGDLGLLLGILLSFSLFGTSNIQTIAVQTAKMFPVGAPIIALFALLCFWGACGKSAQFPLHTWLPDAMEGPTPVSALIHAATMVTAGVYLVARMHAVFTFAPDVLFLIGCVGGFTALFAALSATSQKDLKRVLAYSTLSQLGLMFLACGTGAYFAAIFHLTTHAFVKALLFLAAGNVIHMLHGTTELNKMGGLKKFLPKTNILFLIGTLAMAGIPPLAIFFSKDLILEDVSKVTLFYVTGLTISLLTAFYMMRAYLLTFQGDSGVVTAKEAPKVMWMPVSILALLTVIGGGLGFAISKPPILMRFLSLDSLDFVSPELTFGFHITIDTWVSIIVAVTGVILGLFFYHHVTAFFRRGWELFYSAFYINELYSMLFVTPLRKLSHLTTSFFEPKFFDKGMRTVTIATEKTAALLQEVQSGQIRSYISWIVLGATFLIIYLVLEGAHVITP